MEFLAFVIGVFIAPFQIFHYLYRMKKVFTSAQVEIYIPEFSDLEIPLAGHIAAGPFSSVDDFASERIDINKLLIRHPETFYVSCKEFHVVLISRKKKKAKVFQSPVLLEKEYETWDEVKERVVTFASMAAVKVRKQQSLCS